MAGIFQGTVAPDVETARTTATAAPEFYTDYLSGLAGAGATALERPPGEMVAPLTAMQTAGYAAVPEAATSYQPQLGAAQTTAATAAAGATPETIQGFMNPYTKNVVDEMARLSQQNVQRNLMPSLKAGFVGSGGLGSSRYAGALGQSMADIQQNLTGQQTGALSAGYNKALEAALQQARDQTAAARAQGDLAKTEQELGLTGAGAMTKAGAEQQAFQQAQIDAPLKTATNVSALLRGMDIPKTATETFKGPMAGVYGTSPLSQIAGLGTLFASGAGGTSAIGGVGNFLKGLGAPNTAGVTDLGGGITINPDGSIGGYTPSEPSGSGDWQQDSEGNWFDAGLGPEELGESSGNWWETE